MTDTPQGAWMREYETLRKRVIRDAARAVHEKWCGSPPSCGCSDPCMEAQVNPDEIAIAVDIALRAAHERDADARRLDWLDRRVKRDGRGSGLVELWSDIEATVGIGCDEENRYASVRAAIDAAMAADTQTEGESDGDHSTGRRQP